MIDLSSNYPLSEGQEELLRRHVMEVLSDSTVNLSASRPYFGDPSDVESIKAALVGGQVGAEEASLALTSSGQAALIAAMAAICVRPGVCFATDASTFNKFINALSYFGASAVAVEADEHGMSPDSLVEVCERTRVDALYLMPTFHNPLGTVMPTHRREELAAIARRYDLLVIEDDAYDFLEVNSLEGKARPTIRSMVPERTLQVFSLSKRVSLALRLGALIVPKSIAPRTTNYMRDSGISAHPLATATAARIANDGELKTLAAAKRLEGTARFSIAKSALGDRAISLHPHGWHILLATPNGVPGTQFVEHARTHADLAISPGAAYRVDGRDDPIVRVSFGGERDRPVLADGLKRLAELFP